MKPLLVGEANPYGGDPEFALYPSPPGCAGHRLCHLVLGLDEEEYLERFDRENLCPREWRMGDARVRASEIRSSARRGAVVLLGAKVCAAFEFHFKPFSAILDYANTRDRSIIEPDTGRVPTYVVLPHPSGLSRLWNVRGSFDRARDVLREAGVLS